MSIKIFSSSQIRSLDASTIQCEPIASIDLMERASWRFVEAFSKEVSSENKITVVAGSGNNGGDGLAVARLLQQKNYDVNVFLVKDADAKLSKDCTENFHRWQNIGGELTTIESEDDVSKLNLQDVTIDGLFGSGLNRPLSGIYAQVVEKMNEKASLIYSIDIPSGLFVEDNSQRSKQDAIVCSTKTLTFQFPKLAFLFPENEPFVPDFEVLDIGLSPDAIEKEKTHFFYLQKEDIREMLHTRKRFSHKGTFGHAYLIAGQQGKMGACVLAAKACLRTGVGLLTVHCPKSGVDILQITVPEAMIDADNDNLENTEFNHLLPKHTIGIGPAIGKGEKVKTMFQHLLSQADKPMVIDADALNLLAENRELISLLPPHSILTPHPVEFERLAGKKFDSAFERLQSAQKLAQEWSVIIVLKGAFTAIALPDGRVFFNSTGNPGMATAGSGDCLTGIITSLLAQHYSSEQAAWIGVYIHGLAGDIALKKVGAMESVIASDLIESIGDAFREVRE